MGFNIALIAIDKDNMGTALSALNLQATSKPDEYNECEYSGALAGNNKYVIWKNIRQGAFTKAQRNSLAKRVDFIVMDACEGVMSGSVDSTKNKKLEWSISYNGCDEPKEFATHGSVPAEIIDLRKQFSEQSADDEDGVDYDYEILSESFALFTGLKYDGVHKFKFFELEAKETSYASAGGENYTIKSQSAGYRDDNDATQNSVGKKKTWWKIF